MDFEKHYRRRLKRLKKSLHEPFEKYQALKKLVKLMGAQGVFLHMGKQGRWHPWWAFLACLVLLALFLGVLSLVTHFDHPWWAWFLTTPMLLITSFVHYALWRAAGNMRSSFGATVLRAYTIPMLTLFFFLVVGTLATGLQGFFENFFDGLGAVLRKIMPQ